VDSEAGAMMRATGFLLGTLLVLAAFLFLSGDGTAPPVAVSAVDAVTPDTESSDTERTPAEKALQKNIVVGRVEPPAVATAGTGEESGSEVTSSGLELDPQTWNASLAAHEAIASGAAIPDNATEPSRYRVWTPFHSKWAAEGFAQRLSQATAVPAEVVREGPKEYQVVFSYRDDAERLLLVERIEAVTGLELE